MSDQYILKSVGSFIETNGQIGPLDPSGLPDLTANTVHVLDRDGRSWNYEEFEGKLSPEDRKVYNEIREDFENG